MRKFISTVLITSFLLTMFSIMPTASFAHGTMWHYKHYHIANYQGWSYLRDKSGLPAYLHGIRRIEGLRYYYNGYYHYHGYAWDGCGHVIGQPWYENVLYSQWTWGGPYNNCSEYIW